MMISSHIIDMANEKNERNFVIGSGIRWPMFIFGAAVGVGFCWLVI